MYNWTIYVYPIKSISNFIRTIVILFRYIIIVDNIQVWCLNIYGTEIYFIVINCLEINDFVL